MTSKKVILVALSGCSSSGKTTIAKLTASLFTKATLIHEDDFYKHDNEVPVDAKYNIQNWDSPEALDFKLFGKELDVIKQTGKIATKLIHNNNVDDPFTKFHIDRQVWDELKAKYDSINDDKYEVVIVDGFMIFNNTGISKKFDLKILVRAPYEVLKKGGLPEKDTRLWILSGWIRRIISTNLCMNLIVQIMRSYLLMET